EAALQSPFRHERRRHRMPRREALDGGHLAVHRAGLLAGPDRRAIHQHGARAALTLAAAVLGTGEAQLVAEHVEQRRVRPVRNGALDTVDDQSTHTSTVVTGRATPYAGAGSHSQSAMAPPAPVRPSYRTGADPAPTGAHVNATTAGTYRGIGTSG